MSLEDQFAEQDAALIALHGQDVTYTPGGGAASTIGAYFQSGFSTPGGRDVQFAGEEPQFIVHRDDVANPKRGDTIEQADGTVWSVTTAEHDESDLVVLKVRKA